MSQTKESPALRRRRRRRRERIIILIILVVITVLTWLEIRVVDLGGQLPIANSVLVFSLININVLLLLLVLFLIGRNIIKLLAERRSRALGARLKTKLVLSFMALSLIPTGVLFFVTIQFFNTSIEYWFNFQIDRALQESLNVGRLYYQTSTQEAVAFGQDVAAEIMKGGLTAPGRGEELARLVKLRRKQYHLASLKVLAKDMTVLASSVKSGDMLSLTAAPARDLTADALAKGDPLAEITASRLGDWVSAVVPLTSGQGESGTVTGLVVLSKLTPAGLVERLGTISSGLSGYQQLKMLKGPIKLSQYITLSIVTMLILFAATWFGFKLARTITDPLQELAEGTQRVAAGDYEHTVKSWPGDEIGTVIDSFNLMTQDLKASKEELERTNRELVATNLEIDARRGYMESVLANIAAGVFSIDAQGRVTTMNEPAGHLLGRDPAAAVGHHYTEVLPQSSSRMFQELIEAVAQAPGRRLERHVRLNRDDQALSLQLRLTGLTDAGETPAGMVAVLEDLTQLEKAQRMVAWREVARRIAHEIKNPLTPIKLSAQRLQRRFGDQVGQRDIFDQATTTIIRQVDALKGLVDEFSSFARMPAINPTLAELVSVVEEVMPLYREAHRDIDFDLALKNQPPKFYFDVDQIKRVLINLLDNAVAAIEGAEPDPETGRGRITVGVNYLEELQTIRLEVIDNGPGIDPADKERLFEPYFSTKKQGTGLGLAIVSTIIQDHSGYIRVQDLAPRGSKFVIELPAKIWSTGLEVA